MTQVAPYKPTPITQRDGSPLASSNCRMASIACGLDYETLGAETSTGAKMRSYTDDQSGGTDSGDAKQSWSRGYSESLTVRDGGSWDDVMADLAAGRLVHLDVWHAAVGGPCLSGSGAYGHTMAVLPDQDEDGWLVSDPWCSPPKWSRVSTSKLKAGAEEWGRRVYGETGGDTDTTKVCKAVKRLMSHSYPGRERHLPEPRHRDTSGVPRVLWTVTRSQGGEVMGETFLTSGMRRGVATVTSDVSLIPTAGGDWYHLDLGYQREVVDTVTITSGKYAGSKAYLTKIPGQEATGLLLAAASSYVADPETSDDLVVRQQQYDVDAASLLGKRPA